MNGEWLRIWKEAVLTYLPFAWVYKANQAQPQQDILFSSILSWEVIPRIANKQLIGTNLWCNNNNDDNNNHYFYYHCYRYCGNQWRSSGRPDDGLSKHL
jgi:hypothetical protein